MEPLAPEEEMKEDPTVQQPVATHVAQAPVAAAPAEKAPEEKKLVQTNLNKCWECGKKVGAVKIPCQCTFVFCMKHRLPEDHKCSFDFFKANQQRIEKQNPLIKHDKMQKMF